MQINFTYDTSVGAAPAGFITALTAAAIYLDNLITNNITVNIQVGWGEDDGAAILPNTLSSGGPQSGIGMTYSQLKSYLTANATSAAAETMVANMGTDPTDGGNFYITAAQEKAWGILSSTGTEIDGNIGFSSTEPFNFGTDGVAVAGEYDLEGDAIAEITHALGRFPGLQLSGSGWYSPMDLMRYSSPGVNELVAGQPAYFSLDGGVTNVEPFNDTGGDPSDWAPTVNSDAFGSGIMGQEMIMTSADQEMMSALGYQISGANTASPTPTTASSSPVPTSSSPTPTATSSSTPVTLPPVVPPTTVSPTATYYNVTDTTTGVAGYQNGTAYAGPVAGISQEIILTTSDNLNITAYQPNSFIHTGSGEDAIDVSQAGGNNIMDGSTGSNFLTGGTGDDTFFVDDRNPAAAVWSTLANFHSGDNATIWGLTPNDFNVSWLNDEGAIGHQGLTADFTATGTPTASVTLVGFTTANLGTQLTVSYGSTVSEPGAPGSNYMNIHAN